MPGDGRGSRARLASDTDAQCRRHRPREDDALRRLSPLVERPGPPDVATRSSSGDRRREGRRKRRLCCGREWPRSAPGHA